MCGICGIIGLSEQRHIVENMLNEMHYRGPDDRGIYQKHNITLGQVRLSILDLSSAGHQPMYSHDGRYVIVFNGEIYNYLELKATYFSNEEFISNSDTEVLIKMYERFGKSCLEYLNGMFAFVIYDELTHKIFAARDRFGIKPFYYYYENKVFLFCSEPAVLKKALLANNIECQPNNSIIYDYLVNDRTNHSEATFFTKIKKLQHSHFISIESNDFKISRWYNLRDRISNEESQTPEHFKNLIQEAVSLQLRSDVPLGTCLSGGLDSSSLTAIIESANKTKKLHTFSAVYGKGLQGDESDYIDLFADFSLDMHKCKITGDEFFYDKEDFIKSHQEPVPGASPYAQYRVMKMAKEYVTVILNGQGVDEVLAGYDYFYAFLLKEYLLNKQLNLFWQEFKGYQNNQHNNRVLINLAYLFLPETARQYLKLYSKNFINKDFFRKYHSNTKIVDTIFKQNSLKNTLYSQFENVFEHFLIWGDHSAMHFSMESRFPFLDHRFVEKALSTPNNQKINKGVRKVLLRESMQGLVPDTILTRYDKIGYDTPEDEWMRSNLWKTEINDILNSTWLKHNEYLDYKKMSEMYLAHLSKKNNYGSTIWKMINLYYWKKQFNQ